MGLHEEEDDLHAATPEPSSSAASKVFGTFELLEDILLRLPPKDILLAERVQSRWNETIAGSSKSQQVLFIEPLEPENFREGSPSTLWHHPKHLDAETEGSALRNSVLQLQQPVVNPLLQLLCPCTHSQKASVYRLPTRASYEVFLRNTATDSHIWKMSVLQPPARVVALERFVENRRFHILPSVERPPPPFGHVQKRYFSYISSASGAITVARLLRHLLDLRRNWEPCNYFIIRNYSYRPACELDPYTLATTSSSRAHWGKLDLGRPMVT